MQARSLSLCRNRDGRYPYGQQGHLRLLVGVINRDWFSRLLWCSLKSQIARHKIRIEPGKERLGQSMLLSRSGKEVQQQRAQAKQTQRNFRKSSAILKRAVQARSARRRQLISSESQRHKEKHVLWVLVSRKAEVCYLCYTHTGTILAIKKECGSEMFQERNEEKRKLIAGESSSLAQKQLFCLKGAGETGKSQHEILTISAFASEGRRI